MHIIDIRRYLRCPRLSQLAQRQPVRGFPFYNLSTDLDSSIRRRLGICEFGTGFPNETSDESLRSMEQYHWIFRPRFTYRSLRVKVPLLYHEGSVCDLYFTALNFGPSEEEALNVGIIRRVLAHHGLTVRNVYYLYLNRDYVRRGELDDNALWNLSTTFFNSNYHPSRDILEASSQLPQPLDELIDAVEAAAQQPLAEAKRCAECTAPLKCRYYDQCFPQEAAVPDNSILTLCSSHAKYEMYDAGIRDLKDADPDKVEGTKPQYAQIMADRSGGFYCDQTALGHWLSVHSRQPLSFIDFEWDLYPVPPYDGMRPLQVLPFEYSLDVLEDGRRRHEQFLGTGDCRQAMIEKMLNDLPADGTIFAYNADGAEVLRVRELAQAFPQYAGRLEAVAARMVDIGKPLVMGMLYDVRLRGQYSLKAVQALIDPQHSYHDLPVENGLEAVEIHRKLVNSSDEGEKDAYREELFQYCGLDSLALVELYQWLTAVHAQENDPS